MNNEQRRIEIINKLQNSDMPISATSLANLFSVTRQIIVADIALLRAFGHSIRAEHKGYVLEKENSNEIIKKIVVKHGDEVTTDELYAIVDNGGRVVDVIVEHPIYDKISAELNLASRYDVDCFINKIKEQDAAPLSVLTEGLHIHTVAVKDNEAFDRIIKKLTELKILVDFA